jgi:hypothetical protein
MIIHLVQENGGSFVRYACSNKEHADRYHSTYKLQYESLDRTFFTYDLCNVTCKKCLNTQYYQNLFTKFIINNQIKNGDMICWFYSNNYFPVTCKQEILWSSLMKQWVPCGKKSLLIYKDKIYYVYNVLGTDEIYCARINDTNNNQPFMLVKAK